MSRDCAAIIGSSLLFTQQAHLGITIIAWTVEFTVHLLRTILAGSRTYSSANTGTDIQPKALTIYRLKNYIHTSKQRNRHTKPDASIEKLQKTVLRSSSHPQVAQMKTLMQIRISHLPQQGISVPKLRGLFFDRCLCFPGFWACYLSLSDKPVRDQA